MIKSDDEKKTKVEGKGKKVDAACTIRCAWAGKSALAEKDKLLVDNGGHGGYLVKKQKQSNKLSTVGRIHPISPCCVLVSCSSFSVVGISAACLSAVVGLL